MKISGRLKAALEVCDRADDSVIDSPRLPWSRRLHPTAATFTVSQRRVGQHP